jgi:hypothetical protein
MSGKLRDIDKRKVNKRLLNAAKLSSYRKDKATREEVASNGAEFLNRCKAGKGSYVIKFTDEVLLDCYANRNSSEFLASYANSALNCKDIKTNINSVNNSVICLDQTNKRARLICIKKITIDSEIFCPYSSSYKYP